MKKFLSAAVAVSLIASSLPTVTLNVSAEGAYFTDTRTVDYSTTWGNAKKGYTYTTAENAAKYKFTVTDTVGENTVTQTYSLLDVKDNSSSKYFVITDDIRGSYQFLANDVPKYFDLDTSISPDTTNDSYANTHPAWALNSQYFEKGWSFNNGNAWKGIGTNVRSYIDFSHVWDNENAPRNPVKLDEQYTITAGIAFPSANEVDTYGDRFLVAGASHFILRTLRADGDDGVNRLGKVDTDNLTAASPSWKYQAVAANSGSYQNVRPVFWLNDQFFANVAVDLSTAGAAVKQEIRKVGYSTLSSIYSTSDLDTYVFDGSEKTVGVKFTDASDNEISSVSGQSTVKVSADLTTVASGINACALLAVYDSDGRFEKAATQFIQTSDDKLSNFSISVSGLSAGSGKTAKFMIWNDLTDIIYLCECYSK